MNFKALAVTTVLTRCICCDYKASFNDIVSIEDVEVDTVSYLLVFSKKKYMVKAKVKHRHADCVLRCCNTCYMRVCHDQTALSKMHGSKSFYLNSAMRICYDSERHIFVAKNKTSCYILAVCGEDIACLKIDDFETDSSSKRIILDYKKSAPIQLRDLRGIQSIGRIPSSCFAIQFALDDLVEMEESRCRGLIGMGNRLRRLYMEQIPASMRKRRLEASSRHAEGFVKYSNAVDVFHSPSESRQGKTDDLQVSPIKNDLVHLQSTLDEIRALRARSAIRERENVHR